MGFPDGYVAHGSGAVGATVQKDSDPTTAICGSQAGMPDDSRGTRHPAGQAAPVRRYAAACGIDPYRVLARVPNSPDGLRRAAIKRLIGQSHSCRFDSQQLQIQFDTARVRNVSGANLSQHKLQGNSRHGSTQCVTARSHRVTAPAGNQRQQRAAARRRVTTIRKHTCRLAKSHERSNTRGTLLFFPSALATAPVGCDSAPMVVQVSVPQLLGGTSIAPTDRSDRRWSSTARTFASLDDVCAARNRNNLGEE